MRSSTSGIFFGSLFTVGAILAACSAAREGGFQPTANAGSDSGGGGGGVLGGEDASLGFDAGPPETRDPIDCEEAKNSKSYVGCDYWPTVTPNPVWSLFDFAVVVSNTGSTDATVTVTGPNAVNKQTTVPAGELRKIYLPWVPELKGEDSDACGRTQMPTASTVVTNGAYHLVSSTPVIVYQFSPLQYKPDGGVAPDGGVKNWSNCPAKTCDLAPISCFSYTNDASLLLPTTAMTNNYRITGYGRSTTPSPIVTVTATQPNTTVTLTLSQTAQVLASWTGKTFLGAGPGKKVKLTLDNAGDVVEFVGNVGKDFSGSLVQSDKPVQVIAAVSCVTIPEGSEACDHIEETVLPAETLGKHYAIVPPTGPKGQPVGQVVRLYGNVDGTNLLYQPARPPSCPSTLSAGQVADCDVVGSAFEVEGDKEFGVSTFLLGQSVYGNPLDPKGDPSHSTVASVEQFRTKYVFLAPNDYPLQFADVTAPEGADIEFDGNPLNLPFTKIGAGSFGYYRIDLTKSGKDGVHTLTAKKPVGVQVIGFGDFTSFQYPAGLNLSLIAPAPPPPK